MNRLTKQTAQMVYGLVWLLIGQNQLPDRFFEAVKMASSGQCE